MGDLADDSNVEQTASGLRGAYSPAWEIWGPMGGYAATLSLRAAGLASGRQRPAVINHSFVGIARFGDVEFDVQIVRETSRASAMLVIARQDGATVAISQVWGVDDMSGLEHRSSERPPPVPPPEQTPSLAERLGDVPTMQHAFGKNLEMRPNLFVDWSTVSEPLEPRTDTWYRLVPTARFDDPWTDAGRLLILADLDGWPATTRAHVGADIDYFAPTVELTCRFHSDASGDEWVRAIADAPVASGGLVGHRAAVWSVDDRLLASGGSTLMCRPMGKRPDQHLLPGAKANTAVSPGPGTDG